MRFLRLSMAPWLAVLGLLASGCASQQGRVEDSPAPPPLYPDTPVEPPQVPSTGTPSGAGAPPPQAAAPVPVSPSYPRTIQDSSAAPAVISLYRKAQAERAANQPEPARADLEHAAHIDSRNPFVWQALAGVDLDAKKPADAEAEATNSNRFARGNPYVVSGNWRIIAAARQAQGDADGALQAQAQADKASQAIAPAP